MRKIVALLLLAGIVGCSLIGCNGGNKDSGSGSSEPGEAIVKPERNVNFSFWDWQIGTAGDAEYLAGKIKQYGFTGVDLTFRWSTLEYTQGRYSYRFIDALLDEFAKKDLFISTSLLFWSGGLPWSDEIEWQKLSDGAVCEVPQYGAAPSFADDKTVAKMTDAYRAFTGHIYEKYGDRLIRMHARTSQYGELEYYCGDARGMLDYGAPAIEKFRQYLKDRYQTAATLEKATGGKKSFAGSDDVDAMEAGELTETFYFDWQNFRQEICLELAGKFHDIQKETAPGVPFAVQVGSLWDANASTLRGVFDPYLVSRVCDIIHTDDGPGYPHDFSMDYIDVVDGIELASEIDGRWHPTIEEAVRKGDKSLAPYVTQAEHMGMKGIKYLNTCNWNKGDLDEFEDALSRYPTVFLGAKVREARDESVAILINTADYIMKKRAATELYQTVFNALSIGGSKQVRFVTDTQLIDNPDILGELGELYLGNAFGGIYMREELGALLKKSDVKILAEEDRVSFMNEYGAEMPSDCTPATERRA